MLITAVLASCDMKPGVTIMSGEKSDYVICIPDTANHQIARAATIL